jgi:hypothetical protein
MIRRGPGLLGAAALGGLGYAAGRATASREAEERAQNERLADLEAQQPTGPTPYPLAPPPATSTDDRVRQLQRLGELKASGVLTDEEFQREKRRVLAAP